MPDSVTALHIALEIMAERLSRLMRPRCETCHCSLFRDSAPITVDDVLAAYRLLKMDPLSLADFGIGAIERE